MMATAWKAGDVVENPYPFVRATYFEMNEDGGCEQPTWRPGCEYEQVGPEGEVDAVADGLGKQILTVVDVHKPGKYPTRIFYTCKWVNPDGRAFGKGALKITTVEAFSRRACGFMSHDRYFDLRMRDSTPPREGSDYQMGVAAE